MKQFIKNLLCSILIVMFFNINAKAQDCVRRTKFCPCELENGDCVDIDDPVPLDNGLLLLAGAALIFGLYKLNTRRQFQVRT